MNVAPQKSQWRPANPAHAIQSVFGVVVFAQPVTSLIWKRVADQVKQVASELNLPETGDVQAFMMKIEAGAAPSVAQGEAGIEYFRRPQHTPPPGTSPFVDRVAVDKNSIRLDSLAYTRWVGFSEKLATLLKLLPSFAEAVSIRQIGLEYVDVFVATQEGDVDCSAILNADSDCISGRAFHPTTEWHSHTGWFEDFNMDIHRTLVNVDVTVANANTPEGVRRAISIRTHQALQFSMSENAENAASELNAESVLTIFNDIHLALKDRFGALLTPDAKEMISLGAN